VRDTKFKYKLREAADREIIKLLHSSIFNDAEKSQLGVSFFIHLFIVYSLRICAYQLFLIRSCSTEEELHTRYYYVITLLSHGVTVNWAGSHLYRPLPTFETITRN